MQKVSAPALAPSAQDGGNMVATNTGGGALPGSDPITPLPEAPNQLDQNLPMPKIPAAQTPLSTQSGRYGGKGLPSVPGQSGGGFTTGNQPGGNQGHGNPGAGSSGPDLWKPTLGFGPAGGPQDSGS